MCDPVAVPSLRTKMGQTADVVTTYNACVTGAVANACWLLLKNRRRSYVVHMYVSRQSTYSKFAFQNRQCRVTSALFFTPSPCARCCSRLVSPSIHLFDSGPTRSRFNRHEQGGLAGRRRRDCHGKAQARRLVYAEPAQGVPVVLQIELRATMLHKFRRGLKQAGVGRFQQRRAGPGRARRAGLLEKRRTKPVDVNLGERVRTVKRYADLRRTLRELGGGGWAASVVARPDAVRVRA